MNFACGKYFNDRNNFTCEMICDVFSVKAISKKHLWLNLYVVCLTDI
jgi:hypothetical protein